MSLLKPWRINPKAVTSKKKVAEGGFGVVLKGLYQDRPCAVKQVLPGKMSRASMNMFRDEMLLCAKLQHPSIIRFYGCSWELPFVFIVLEFAERGSLRDLLRRKDMVVTLEGVLLRMAGEIASGMHYLHTRPRPVIHRDIKSDNVLVTDLSLIHI